MNRILLDNIDTYVLLDDKDYKRVMALGYKWHGAGNGKIGDKKKWYARSTILRNDEETRYVLMHRVIVGAKGRQVVDFINGDTLDLRRQNLRIRANNRVGRPKTRPRNSEGTRGVVRFGKRYQARCSDKYLGRYDTLDEAIASYEKEAKKRWGKNAKFVRNDFRMG